jgi:hypothetical protein
LNLDLHVKGFSTPGSREVEELFCSVGLDKVWGAIETKKPGSRIYRRSLDSLVARRHPIAHGDSGAMATLGDVRQYINDMRELAEIFDVVVTEHLLSMGAPDDLWATLNSV